MNHGDDGGRRGFPASLSTMVLLVFLAVGGFYLIAEHTAHLVGYAPLLLLLLLCGGMHFFMHGSHGGHGHGGHGGRDGGTPDAVESDRTGDRR